MLKLFPFLTLFFMYSCNVSNAYQNSLFLTVDQVRDNPEYASQIVDMRGEVIVEYHGAMLCGHEGTPCFFVVLPIKGDPEQGFELEEDYLYKKYEDLSIEIGLVQKKLGTAKLFATLKGMPEYYTYSDDEEEVIIKDFKEEDDRLIRVRFVLQKVLELDIRPGSGKLDPWLSTDPADLEELLRGNDKDK